MISCIKKAELLFFYKEMKKSRVKAEKTKKYF